MLLPRLQLFEFNDQHWVPQPLRDTLVEALSRTLRWGGIVRGLVEPFADFVQRSGVDEVLDLGSGAGGPAHILATELQRTGRPVPRFVLTDLHPRLEVWEPLRAAWPHVVQYVPEPVDATRIPERLAAGRVRTLINVLHHLTPSVAQNVLRDAVRGSRGVFVAEAFARNPLRFLTLAPAGLPALLVTPLLSPKERAAKALLVWGSPTALAAGVWDGFVSTMRVYTHEELRAMVAPFGDEFQWKYGTAAYSPWGRATYFFGLPTRPQR